MASAMLPRRRLVVSPSATTRSDGANRAASASQVGSTEVGATTKNGGYAARSPSVPVAPSASAASSRSCTARRIIARVCIVLPRPMSFARMPLSPPAQEGQPP
jgi:hypothetical protein